VIARVVLFAALAGVLGGMGYAAVSFWLDDGPEAEERTFDPGQDLTLEEVLAAVDEGLIEEIEYQGTDVRITLCNDPREYTGDAAEDEELAALLRRQDIDFGAGGSGASTRSC
jgi:hypothetical protein